MLALFSYDMVDSDETEGVYRKMLDDDAGRFAKWRAGGETRAALPLVGAFAIWWFAKGPTTFRTGADAVRYRRDLLSALEEPTRG